MSSKDLTGSCANTSSKTDAAASYMPSSSSRLLFSLSDGCVEDSVGWLIKGGERSCGCDWMFIWLCAPPGSPAASVDGVSPGNVANCEDCNIDPIVAIDPLIVISNKREGIEWMFVEVFTIGKKIKLLMNVKLKLCGKEREIFSGKLFGGKGYEVEKGGVKKKKEKEKEEEKEEEKEMDMEMEKALKGVFR
ncbi:uncharacterized protein MONOS_9889 [Monocercomonoides exilis]|uniref:uncharacterized protein n=1 Tax=Monocercomonoides exilis TaxID=2049356 RepID=UPI003559A6E6|nr:hypothetical protein MONOS_9889 [Monocercomonoides exilis]|eukprot:MONOS_9889.1-p1 / transcript=MONOS_9889.1 / gene=MONOS_9889 / organism=Monocercomonoides_exilis_PA203 / gene_product=unspecified product / transcript_product=unspecified product / location=Mono_scaffold00424:52999-53642(-) / protein_length=191 / sequence_SO=supercontig / SO=protein_coding / is_pseudo=false